VSDKSLEGRVEDLERRFAAIKDTVDRLTRAVAPPDSAKELVMILETLLQDFPQVPVKDQAYRIDRPWDESKDQWK
jgi:uncharacterized coiled-coil protein SlyX